MATISGGSKYLLERLRQKCQEYERKMGRSVSVACAAKLLADSVTATMCTGGLLKGEWDEKGTSLYHVDSLGKLVDVKGKKSLGGTPLNWTCYATGSGATGAISYMNSKLMVNMCVTNAQEVAKGAICFAAYLATEIGAFVSVYHIGCSGPRQLVFGDDIEEWQKQNVENPQLEPT